MLAFHRLLGTEYDGLALQRMQVPAPRLISAGDVKFLLDHPGVDRSES